jgi:hypothetical protein
LKYYQQVLKYAGLSSQYVAAARLLSQCGGYYCTSQL